MTMHPNGTIGASYQQCRHWRSPLAPMAPSNSNVMVRVAIYSQWCQLPPMVLLSLFTANGAYGNKWCYCHHWCHWCQKWSIGDYSGTPILTMAPMAPIELVVMVTMIIHWRSNGDPMATRHQWLNGTIGTSDVIVIVLRPLVAIWWQ